MRSEKIVIPGKPQGKGRPRFTRYGSVYTPPSTRIYEEKIREAWGDRELIHSPITIWIDAYLPISSSASKTDKYLMKIGSIKAAKKPDIDNVIKAVLDALNGIAYDDDKQVVILHAVKKYSDTPRVEVTIEEAI